MAESQTTLTLLLQAKDEATAVFKQVGDQMATLGRQREALMETAQARGFDVGNVEALRTVTKAQTEIVRQGVSERMQAIAEEGRDFATAYRADATEALRASRETRDQEIEDARTTRDAKLAALKEETTLSKAERKAQQDAIRTEANAAMAQARTDHAERLRMNKEALAANMAEVQRYVAAEQAPLRFAVPAVAAGAEQQRAADILRGTTEARILAEDRMGALQEALRIPEPEGLKLAAIDLHKIAEDAAQTIPSVKEFAASLRQAIAGAGDRPTDQFVAIRTAVRDATQVIKEGAREQEEAVRNSAQAQKQAVAADLADQKDRINEYVRSQTAQIEMFSRQIQQLLRTAYSAPGISDALKAEGQKVIGDLRVQSDVMADEYRKRGHEMTREAERTARDVLDATDTELKAELRAVQHTTQQKIEARRQEATQIKEDLVQRLQAESAASKRLEALGIDAGKPLSRLVDIGRQMLVWNVGYRLVGQVTSGIAQTAAGLVSTNAQVEQLSQTFAAVYQTSTQASEAMIHGLDQFAAKVPATRAEVRDAALQFAAAGDNVSKMLEPASNLAAIMGVDLPRAAQAMIDAQMGRFQMLQMTLKTTKEELVGYGLQVDSSGHVLNNSFVPAIERYAQARFGEHLAMDAKSAKEAGESLYFSTQQVRAFHAALAEPATSNVARDIQAGAQIAAGALPIGTPDAVRTATLTQTMTALEQARHGEKQGLQELHELYGVNAADLDKINKNWRSSGAAAQSAFAQWLEGSYGGQKALQNVQAQQSAVERQMKTLGGLWSNVQDAFENLQEVIGKGVFNVLHNQIQTLINFLQSPVLLSWGAKIGTAMGEGLQTAVNWIKEVYHNLGGLPGIIVIVTRAWDNASQILRGLWDALKLVSGVLSVLVQPLVVIARLFSGLGVAGSDNTSVMRTLASIFGTLIVAITGARGALTIYNTVAATLKTVTDLAKDSVQGLTTAEGEQGLTAASNSAKSAESNLKTAIDQSVEAEVAAKTATMDLSVVLGENGLAATAGTAGTEMKALATASGEAGAAGALGIAQSAVSRFGGVLGGIRGLLSGTSGMFIAMTANIYLWSQAFNQAMTNIQRQQNINQLRDIGKSLMPEQPAVFGHTLWQGPASGHGGVGYESYALAATGGDPSAFIQYLLGHPAVMKRYQQTMQRQGRLTQAEDAIHRYQSLAAGGAGGVISPEAQQAAANQQAYSKALETFQAALKYRPQEAMADLQAVVDAYQQMQQTHESVAQAMQDANKMYTQLLAQVPKQYQDTGGYLPKTPPGGQDAATQNARDTAKAATKALGGLLAQWQHVLALLRQGKIDPTSAQNQLNALAPQISEEALAAGRTDPTQKLSDQETGALQAAYGRMAHAALTRFRVDLGDAVRGLHGKTRATIEAELSHIGQLETEAGLPDTTTDLEQAVTDAFDRQARGVAQGRMRELRRQFQMAFDRLKHHIKGYTVQRVEAIIGQLQSVEIGAGLADDTAPLLQRVQDFEQAQGTAATKTAARSQLQDLIATRSDDMAHFLALKRQKHYAEANALIDTIIADTDAIDKARHMSWNARIKDEDALRTRLQSGLAPASDISSAYTRPAEPRYMPYGGLGRQPGFGGVEVQFGGPQADPTARLVATLREQLSVAREQIKHLQALLQPAQLTATNTGRIAGIILPGYGPSPGPSHPVPPQPSVAAIRRGGAMFTY
jgi:hypothetical protein